MIIEQYRGASDSRSEPLSLNLGFSDELLNRLLNLEEGWLRFEFAVEE